MIALQQAKVVSLFVLMLVPLVGFFGWGMGGGECAQEIQEMNTVTVYLIDS